MPDSVQSLQATGVIGILNALRGFIRDVGTPVTVLLFCGLIYTGMLRSPITTIETETSQSIREHAALTQAGKDEKMLLVQMVGVMRVMCRNQPGLNDSQRALCDFSRLENEVTTLPPSRDMAPIVSEERGQP